MKFLSLQLFLSPLLFSLCPGNINFSSPFPSTMSLLVGMSSFTLSALGQSRPPHWNDETHFTWKIRNCETKPRSCLCDNRDEFSCQLRNWKSLDLDDQLGNESCKTFTHECIALLHSRRVININYPPTKNEIIMKNVCRQRDSIDALSL